MIQFHSLSIPEWLYVDSQSSVGSYKAKLYILPTAQTVRGAWNSKTLTIWGHLHLHRHCPVAFWDMHWICRHGPDLIKSSSAPVTLSETHEWVMARRGPGNQIALSKSSLYNPQRAQKSRYRSAKTSLRKLRKKSRKNALRWAFF